MALHFYKHPYKPRAELIHSWSDKQLNELSAIIEDFKEKTGVYLDPYADTRINNQHLMLLCTLLENKDKEFISKFGSNSNFNSDIIAVGD